MMTSSQIKPSSCYPKKWITIHQDLHSTTASPARELVGFAIDKRVYWNGNARENIAEVHELVGFAIDKRVYGIGNG
jgi:hypothetical protein